jgi:hypothetical protein
LARLSGRVAAIVGYEVGVHLTDDEVFIAAFASDVAGGKVCVPIAIT